MLQNLKIRKLPDSKDIDIISNKIGGSTVFFSMAMEKKDI